MINLVKNYWQSLEPRERLVLLAGAIFLVVILFYSQLWRPLQKSLDFMENSVRNMRVNAVWVEQRSQELKRGGQISATGPKRGSDQSLMAIVEQTASQAGVQDAIQQIVPDQTTGEVRVLLEGVQFNQWVLWVDNLYKNYGVDITQLNAEKDDDKPNIAEIRLSFIR